MKIEVIESTDKSCPRGMKWVEMFRWAENGVQTRRVFICSYEKGLNHGN